MSLEMSPFDESSGTQGTFKEVRQDNTGPHAHHLDQVNGTLLDINIFLLLLDVLVGGLVTNILKGTRGHGLTTL